jgi:Tesmin/TSO1-like CXC domain, cysteine-rich domain
VSPIELHEKGTFSSLLKDKLSSNQRQTNNSLQLFFFMSSSFSFSTLQYCECYAANVNCSKNCRCVGCKNMGGAAAAAAAVAAAAAAASYYDGTELSAGGPPPPFPIPHLHPGQVMQSARDASAASAGKKKPPGEQPLQAAQNLAFLKHGASPDGKGEKGEGDDDAPAEEGVQALMLAAYAMTEFGQGSSPSKSKADLKREADEGEEPTGKRAKV